MIKLNRPNETTALKLSTRRYLDSKQTAANAFAARSAAIASSWAAFLGTKAREDVAQALDEYHHFKCAYCENVAAQDIEHFYPKSDYPNRMFKWTNFVRGCKNCNNAKRHKFPMDGTKPLLIDPCTDEPLDFFRIDYATGMIVVNPSPAHNPIAETTCGMFGLNQEPLREERRHKFRRVQYLLARVVAESPLTDETKEQLREEMLANRPWLGIIRQFLKAPGQDYAPLVAEVLNRVPEINGWVAEWL